MCKCTEKKVDPCCTKPIDPCPKCGEVVADTNINTLDPCVITSYCDDGCDEFYDPNCITLVINNETVTLVEILNSYNNQITNLTQIIESIQENCCSECDENTPIFTCNIVNNELVVTATMRPDVLQTEVNLVINGTTVTPIISNGFFSYTDASVGEKVVSITVKKKCNDEVFTFNCSQEVINPCERYSLSINDDDVKNLIAITDCPNPTFTWQFIRVGSWFDISTQTTFNPSGFPGLIRLCMECDGCPPQYAYSCALISNTLNPFTLGLLDTVNNGVMTVDMHYTHFGQEMKVFWRRAGTTVYTSYEDTQEFDLDFNSYSQIPMEFLYQTPCGEFTTYVCYTLNDPNATPTDYTDVTAVRSSTPCDLEFRPGLG